MSRRVPFNKTGLSIRSPDYSQSLEYMGDGKPGCPDCGGRGVVRDPASTGVPTYLNCRCARARMIGYNVERGWKGLMRSARIASSPLRKHTQSNVWVRGEQVIFRKHLKHVAIRHIAQHGPWFFKVVTDADLMTAWLATTVLRGGEVYDPDAQHPSLAHMTLVDLILPPDLLIIYLGVKTAANKEMPGVLREALSTRYHEDKPTWICDQPYAPFGPGHLCYSESLRESLAVWEYIGNPLWLGSREMPSQYGVHEIQTGDEEEEDEEEGSDEDSTPSEEESTQGATSLGRGNASLGLLGGGGSTIRYSEEKKTNGGKRKMRNKGKGKRY